MGSHSSQAHGNCFYILQNRSTGISVQQRLQTQNDELERMPSWKIITFYKTFESINYRASEDWNSLKYDQVSKKKNCGLSLNFYEHFIAYSGLLKKRRPLILFLRSHTSRAKVFIVVHVHHGR